MDALAVALALLAACGSDQKTCQVDRQCPDGLVCLLFEDSLEGACYPPACAAEWMGYGCDTSDTGT